MLCGMSGVKMLCAVPIVGSLVPDASQSAKGSVAEDGSKTQPCGRIAPK